MISWFNNSRLMSFLLTPLSKLQFFRFIQRLRICEHCAYISCNIHWTKADYIENGKMKYTHIWLCDSCFYNKNFAHKFINTCVSVCWPHMKHRQV